MSTSPVAASMSQLATSSSSCCLKSSTTATAAAISSFSRRFLAAGRPRTPLWPQRAGPPPPGRRGAGRQWAGTRRPRRRPPRCPRLPVEEGDGAPADELVPVPCARRQRRGPSTVGESSPSWSSACWRVSSPRWSGCGAAPRHRRHRVRAGHPLLLLPHQHGRRRGPRRRSCTPSICRRKVV
jgi:hypothetical protein